MRRKSPEMEPERQRPPQRLPSTLRLLNEIGERSVPVHSAISWPILLAAQTSVRARQRGYLPTMIRCSDWHRETTRRCRVIFLWGGRGGLANLEHKQDDGT